MSRAIFFIGCGLVAALGFGAGFFSRLRGGDLGNCWRSGRVFFAAASLAVGSAGVIFPIWYGLEIVPMGLCFVLMRADCWAVFIPRETLRGSRAIVSGVFGHEKAPTTRGVSDRG